MAAFIWFCSRPSGDCKNDLEISHGCEFYPILFHFTRKNANVSFNSKTVFPVERVISLVTLSICSLVSIINKLFRLNGLFMDLALTQCVVTKSYFYTADRSFTNVHPCLLPC